MVVRELPGQVKLTYFGFATCQIQVPFASRLPHRLAQGGEKFIRVGQDVGMTQGFCLTEP